MTDFLSCFDYSQPLSLYIHVPFCEKKCSYCAFYSTVENSKLTFDTYTDIIVSEINKVSALMDNKPFYTAFLGGGNPGILGIKNLDKIVDAVCKNGFPVEFTTEMNPESLTLDMKDLFTKGLNRLSMGVQSLDEKALTFLGRNASLNQTLKRLETSQRISSQTGCRLSYDLITCLGEFHDYLLDIKRITKEFPTGHLSVYTLTLEEGTTLYKIKPNLPDSDRQADILQEIWTYLESLGYVHYEVSNFAKSGQESLHNTVYWDYKQYLGLGPGAASTAFGKRPCRINVKHSVKDFLTCGSFNNSEFEFLTKEEMKEELILMGLRHKKGLDLNRLKNEFGISAGVLPKNYKIVNSRLVPDDFGLLTADAAALYIDSNW